MPIMADRIERRQTADNLERYVTNFAVVTKIYLNISVNYRKF